MKKLPNNFKKILNPINKILETNTDTYDYKKLENIHKMINKIMIKNRCEPYDMDNIINNYPLIGREHSIIVKKMRKYIIKRNKELARKIYKCAKWDAFVKNIKKEINERLGIDVINKHIIEGIIEVFKKYSTTWDGYWSFALVNKSGLITKLNMIDIEDNEIIRSYIERKYKKM